MAHLEFGMVINMTFQTEGYYLNIFYQITSIGQNTYYAEVKGKNLYTGRSGTDLDVLNKWINSTIENHVKPSVIQTRLDI